VRTIRVSMEVENTARAPYTSSPDRGNHIHSTGINNSAAALDAPGIFTSVVTRRYPTSALQRLEESIKELLHKAWGKRDSNNRSVESGGVLALVVELKDLSPAVSLQQLLFSRLSRSEEVSGVVDEPSKPMQTVQSIAARHGRDNFSRPILTDVKHPLPERRFQMRELVPG
jgi:hypothetical protein